MKVEKLNPAQLERLKFILNDWAHHIRNKNTVISEILYEMAKGVV